MWKYDECENVKMKDRCRGGTYVSARNVMPAGNTRGNKTGN